MHYAYVDVEDITRILPAFYFSLRMCSYSCMRITISSFSTILVVYLILMNLFALGIHPWIMMTVILKTRISI
jgi:hypothetical protein